MQFHRNSQKRFYDKDFIYFVVTKTHNNYPYFKETILCDLFLEDLRLAKKLKGFKLYGFCIVYDHINLLLQPNDEYNISRVMQFLKRHFSRDANYLITNEGDIRECRLQGGRHEKFSEIVKRHDKKLRDFKTKFIQKYGHNHNIPKFKWQKSYYDHVIRNGRDFENHWNYCSYNHVKHEMGEDWKYCAENYWELIDELG